MNIDQAYSKDYDCGFNAGFIAGVESGYGKGYDDATKAAIREGGFQSLAQVLQKEYTCYSCKQPILISKVDDPNSKKKWEQWELDSVTPHDCPAKKKPSQQQADNGPQIAALAEELKGLKETVNILIFQIQMLRLEVKQNKK